jgi:hypothetical protein
MESPESRTFAQFGGALVLISLVLPWFGISVAGFDAIHFGVWKFDTAPGIVLAAYGLFAIAQIRLSSRDAMALIYLLISGLMTAALIYKIWISPPGSAPIGDIGGVDVGISGKDLLKGLGIDLKPTYGAYVAMIGSLLFVAGSFIEFRNAGMARDAVAAPNAAPTGMSQAPTISQGQRYQAPAPQTYTADPFAVPQQAAGGAAAAPQQQIAPDPFAVPPAPPTT